MDYKIHNKIIKSRIDKIELYKELSARLTFLNNINREGVYTNDQLYLPQNKIGISKMLKEYNNKILNIKKLSSYDCYINIYKEAFNTELVRVKEELNNMWRGEDAI